jgi:hypothetical protein
MQFSLALALISRVHLDFTLRRSKKEIFMPVHYHCVTDLGVGFCNVCCRDELEQLKRIDEQSRAARIKADSSGT